ncbi:CocE/NonD family hydrolase [Actinophytocola sp.]|jgi:hypothetical protein|uniref:CocE/NonD family hydrolase n=1 Tax=Actinophytocola sp. TaxID=1872138 RepID=UPI002ED98DD2
MSHHRPATQQRCEVEVVRDVRIPTGDPRLTLSADLYRPVTAGKVPALVTVVPYRKDFVGGLAHDGPARWFAERGYAGVLVDLRGTGSSDGVRRPEFDPGEADDALAAIGWAAGQDWCDGAVGMWGHSYGATVTMRAASRRPPRLRAIIPLMHGLDPGRDTVHPDGARGDLHALVNRGTSMLVQQLLPPLADLDSRRELDRWRTRLHDTEPIFLDYARHGPGDPVWRDRAIDGEAVVVPALCVGGWRDAFPDALIQAYERMRGPKKLLVGPWGHVLPQDSGVVPIDFLALAQRWWDHWLRGIDTGVMAEPPVTLYVEGARPAWRGYDSWPPPGDIAPVAATLDQEPDTHDAVEYRPDPTAGALRGLPGLCLGESCPPQDQHDDDLRSVSATSDPLPDDLVITGRTEVLVKLAGDHDGRLDPVRRLVVRLTHVDGAGRSTLITAGVLTPATSSASHRVVLRPVAYRVPAGRRLRVAVGDADFPRLTPLAAPSRLRVVGMELTVPTTSPAAGTPVELVALPRPPQEPPTGWTITRDQVHDGVEVEVVSRAHGENPWYDYRFEASSELRATVRRAAPDAVVMRGTHRATVWLGTGDKVAATATLRCTQTTLRARGEVTVDDLVVYSRVWETTLAPCAE